MIEIGEIHIAQQKCLYFLFKNCSSLIALFLFFCCRCERFWNKILIILFWDKVSWYCCNLFFKFSICKKLRLRMKIKLKDSSPLAKLPIAKRKDKNRFWKTKLLHTHLQDIYTGSSNLLGHGQLNPKNLLSSAAAMLWANAVFWL